MKSSFQGPNALPVYVQVAELLIRDIGAGRLIDGERLPPEREMSKQLGVSIGTLRKALAELETKGLLDRVHGSGNYVRTGNDGQGVYAMFRLELLGGGGLPRATILSVETLRKPGDLPEFGQSSHASRIRRLRYLNDTIVALEEIWLDRAAGEVTAAALSDSLYHFYQSQLGFWIRRAEDRVSLAKVPEWSPDAFTKPVGSVTGYVERFSWSDLPEPVEFSRTWFDTDRAVYVQRLR
ncbi:MAG: GntR family transcriptional regulator [Pseudomonadota bacterium]